MICAHLVIHLQKKLIFQSLLQSSQFDVVNFSCNAFEWKIDVASLQLKILFYDFCVLFICAWSLLVLLIDKLLEFFDTFYLLSTLRLLYSFLDLPLIFISFKNWSNLLNIDIKASHSLWHKSFIFFWHYKKLYQEI